MLPKRMLIHLIGFLIVSVGFVTLADFKIRQSITDSVAYIKRMVFTQDGTPITSPNVVIDGSGIVLISGDLYSTKISGNQLCIGTDCKTSWPNNSPWLSGNDFLYYTGNIGIGTNNPQTKLDVLSTTSGNTAKKIMKLHDEFNSGLSGQWVNFWGNSALLDLNFTSVYGSISFGGGTTNYNDLLPVRDLIINNGKVGINKSNPLFELDVDGLINGSGGLCIAGECKSNWSQVSGGIDKNMVCQLFDQVYDSSINKCKSNNYFSGSGTDIDPYRLSSLSYNSIYTLASSCQYYNINAFTDNIGLNRLSGNCGNSQSCLYDGIYLIDPDGVGGNNAFNVYCDMNTSGGGWTQILNLNGTPIYSNDNWSSKIGNVGVPGSYIPFDKLGLYTKILISTGESAIVRDIDKGSGLGLYTNPISLNMTNAIWGTSSNRGYLDFIISVKDLSCGDGYPCGIHKDTGGYTYQHRYQHAPIIPFAKVYLR